MVGIVERAVDVLELRDQLLAARRRTLVAASISALALDLEQLAEQLLAACNQPLALAVAGAYIIFARGQPHTAEHDDTRERQCRVSGDDAVVWKIG
ncbi:MAG TPA: hypothetical protein VFF43_22910, partial [Caldimonas sp.]|nr:hypothetical protein [Caldimonas sp.]